LEERVIRRVGSGVEEENEGLSDGGARNGGAHAFAMV